MTGENVFLLQIDRLEVLTDEVLRACWETVRCHVVEERLQVAVELGDLASCDVAVYLHGSVHADPELPAAATDSDGALAATDGLHVAKTSEPTQDTDISMATKN